MAETKRVSGPWLVEQSCAFDELVIEEGAVLTAPEDHWLTLTVDGQVKTLSPGTYKGEVKLSVTPRFRWETYRFGQTELNAFRAGIVIKDGKYLPEYSVSAGVLGGHVGDGEAGGQIIYANDWDFNGFYVTGKGEYTINKVKMCLTGDGTDDFSGQGAGIAVSGDVKLTVNDAEIHNFGISRGCAFIGENADVTFNDCYFTLDSGVYTQQELASRQPEGGFRMLEPPWMMGVMGHGRTTNQAGMSTVHYNRCRIVSNSWGCLSIDGGCVTRMYVKDSVLEVTGESGYGVFSIADDVAFDYAALGAPGCNDVLDHCLLKGVTYPIIMSLGSSGGEFINGTEIHSRWGSLIFRNSGGVLKVNTKTALYTTQSSFMVKGSNAYIHVDDAILRPDNGIILQLQDNDEMGMGVETGYPIPWGLDDKKDPDRDVFNAVATEDVFMTVSNMEAVGDFFNGTTNLFANSPPPMELPPGADAPPAMDFGQIRAAAGPDLQGAKNLDLTITAAQVTGLISAGRTVYNTDLKLIKKADYQLLGDVHFEAQPVVNNGVILTLGQGARWTVTGTCYLSRLVVDASAAVQGTEGKALRLTVDGAEQPLVPGEYRGAITIELV